MTRPLLACLPLLGLLVLARPASAGPEGMPMPPPEGRGRIGVQVQPMTPELREHMHAPSDAGVLVVRVDKDSPAAAAGIEVGDVVTRAGGEPLDGPFDLVTRVAQVPEGEQLTLELVRDGKTLTLKVAPKGAPVAADTFERFLPGGFHHGMLEQRLDDLERRLEQLEKRMPEEKPS